MKHLLILLAVISSFSATIQARNVKGTVTCGRKNLSGVIVTDGKKFTSTDKNGSFEMDIHDDASFVYIVTPSGYAADWSTGVPQFYQKAEGKNSFNFDLKKLPESKSTYSILAIGDPQPSKEEHVAEFSQRPSQATRLWDALFRCSLRPIQATHSIVQICLQMVSLAKGHTIAETSQAGTISL